MRISDWSSDVCSSDLAQPLAKWPTASSFSLVRSASVEPKDSSIISFSRPVGFCPAGARLDQKKLWFHTCPALLNRPLSPLSRARRDRKSVVSGKSVSVRVDLGGRRIITKKHDINNRK